MKKDIHPAAFSAHPEMKLVKEDAAAIETSAFFQVSHELAAIINFRTLTTPIRIQPLDSSINRFMKRSVDVFLSAIFIIGILSWLLPIIAIIIKLDSKGPVFFLQKRNNRNGGIFTCIKFRSMLVNEDADVLPARENDKRITRFGKFLRKHYLDEIPQFLNVFWGDMSIVGPRPHMLSDNLKYEGLVKNYTYRHHVKPGITGLAQVLGYLGPADTIEKMEARVNMDIFYARHWSARMDIIILYRTICKSFGM